MKLLQPVCFFLLCWLTATPLIAQKAHQDEGLILGFTVPYESITLSVDDDEVDYVITAKTVFAKNVAKSTIKVGQKAKVAYVVENGQRVAQSISVLDDKIEVIDQFTGVFDYLDGEVAYVDGRKIILLPTGVIECPGKKLLKDCGCEKTRAYTGFADRLVRPGSFFTVKGKPASDGVIRAREVKVCRNKLTADESELRNLVEQSYDANGLVSATPPAGFNPANPLYKGNIKIGDLEYKLYDNIRVQGYINMVGNRVLPEFARETEFQEANKTIFRFYVIDNPIPNAFAYPNGMVFIHTGLLKLMDNEAQLALVLGHEVAHVLYEHSVKRYKNSKLLGSSMMTGIWDRAKSKMGDVTGSNAQPANVLDGFVSQLAPQHLSGLFDKGQETQADRVGLSYMYLAGYDLREAPKFWLKMKEVTGDESFMAKNRNNALAFLQQNRLNFDQNLWQQVAGAGLGVASKSLLETIYASHPQTVKRYEDINQLIGQYYKDEDFSKAVKGDKEFKNYLVTIK